jgi:hypothetical protein
MILESRIAATSYLRLSARCTKGGGGTTWFGILLVVLGSRREHDEGVGEEVDPNEKPHH